MIKKHTIQFVLGIFLLALIGLSACSNLSTTNPTVASYSQVYLVAAANHYQLKAVTTSPACPMVEWDGKPPQAMKLRVGQDKVAMRKKSDGIDANFPVISCEMNWPENAQVAKVGQQVFQLPPKEIKRIVVIGDTGCRLKASESFYQDCNDEEKWPLAKVMKHAAEKNPDLVLHVGDLHYRESPCPDTMPGCKNSPWGYGFDAWKADFFVPAKPLLNKAAWAFVRGNHEVCSRAGQGWQRFIDTNPWQEKRSCNNPANDIFGDYSDSYAVSLGKSAQILLFDSSKNGSKKITEKDESYKFYINQFKQIENLAKNKAFNILSSHHPVNILLPSKKSDTGTAYQLHPTGYTNILNIMYGDSLLNSPFNLSMHGHNHLFEAISYENNHPAEIVSGNGGSSLEELNIGKITLTEELKKRLKIKEFASFQEFGFGTFDRVDELGLKWLFTEYDVNGKSLFSCDVSERKVICNSKN